MNGDEIVVVDIETTGFSYSKDTIIEVGIAKMGMDGKIELLMNELCKEQKPLNYSAWIFKHSSLKPSEVLKAKDFKTLKPAMQKIFDEYLTTSYNMKFDIDFLENRGLRIRNQYFDIMELAKHICKIPGNGTGYYGQYKNPNFKEAYEYIVGKPLNQLHRAGSDAFLEAELLYRIRKDYPNVFKVL